MYQKLQQQYPIIFGSHDDDEIDNEDELEQEELNELDDPKQEQGDWFSHKWGWLRVVHIVSDLTKESFNTTMSTGLIEVLNLYCYSIDLNTKEREIDDQANNKFHRQWG